MVVGCSAAASSYLNWPAASRASRASPESADMHGYSPLALHRIAPQGQLHVITTGLPKPVLSALEEHDLQKSRIRVFQNSAEKT
jgi:hypothetical protein